MRFPSFSIDTFNIYGRKVFKFTVFIFCFKDISVTSIIFVDIKRTFIATYSHCRFISFGQREIHKLRSVPSFNINRSEEHTSELQSRPHLVCRLLLEKKKKTKTKKQQNKSKYI